jgi:MFS family permease
MEQWSGVYLRTALGLPALAGASGVAVYHASMAAGRLVCAGVIGRLGEVRTLRAAGLLTTVGMLVALASPTPVLVVTGFLTVGLALSAVLPTALTLTASTGSTAAGAASSLVTTISYGGFLLGPILVGTLAGVIGLRGALGIITIIGIAIATLAAATRPGQPAWFAR